MAIPARSPRDEFDSGLIERNGVYLRTYNELGEFWYECLFHKDMIAVIEVPRDLDYYSSPALEVIAES